MTVSSRMFSTAVALLLALSFAHADSETLWTEQPVHIDRSKQTYERLPAVKVENDKRSWVLVPARIKVLSSISFSYGDKQYQLANIRPIQSRRLCAAIEGGRWACGRMAAIFLGNLVRGKRLLCETKPAGKQILLSNCVAGTRDIAKAIIANGYGMAENDKALLAVQAGAQKAARMGLWRNPACVNDFDRC